MTTSAIKISENIDIEKLPSIPQTLISIIDQFNAEDPDFEKITRIIQEDPALTTKILEIANSAQYVQFKLSNFKNILVSLGLDNVKNITTTAAVQQFFSQFNDDPNNTISSFWLTSLHAAFFAKALAQLTDYPYTEEAYLAGLIHKIGQLILINQNNDSYRAVLKSKPAYAEYNSEEINIFGISSAHLGSRIVKDWKISSLFADAIFFQHANIEQVSEADLLIKIINISQRFANLDKENEDEKLSFFTSVYDLFGLTQAIVEELIQSIQLQVKQTAIGLGIELNSIQTTVLYKKEYSLNLARQVKQIAIKGSIDQVQVEESSQVITNLLQNIHIIFGLKQCLYFSYLQDTNELACSAITIDTSIDLGLFKVHCKSQQSLLAKSYQTYKITSSFEQKTDPDTTSSILDQQIARLLDVDGFICVPLFLTQENNDKQSFGTIVIGINQDRYPSLLLERKLIGDFTRSAVLNLSRVSRLNVEQSKIDINDESKAIDKERSLRINKLIHEANNPLTIINNYLQVLSIKTKNSDLKLDSQIEIIQSEIQRVADILLTIKSPPVDTKIACEDSMDLNLTISNLISIYKPSFFQTNGIDCKLYLSTDIPDIICDEDAIKQVLINLIKNSVEELNSGGIIEIETFDNIILNKQPYIEINVSDNGSGLSEEKINQLFIPLKTSKGKQNSGLGLSICKNLIDQLDGIISCKNKEDKGLKFTILLPRKLK